MLIDFQHGLIIALAAAVWLTLWFQLYRLRREASVDKKVHVVVHIIDDTEYGNLDLNGLSVAEENELLEFDRTMIAKSVPGVIELNNGQ